MHCTSDELRKSNQSKERFYTKSCINFAFVRSKRELTDLSMIALIKAIVRPTQRKSRFVLVFEAILVIYNQIRDKLNLTLK